MWSEVVAYILVFIVGILAAILGDKWRRAVKVLRELAEAMEATAKAIEDGKVTIEEAKKVIKEWRDVIAAVVKG